jgi:pre-mRNA-processing factor 17
MDYLNDYGDKKKEEAEVLINNKSISISPNVLLKDQINYIDTKKKELLYNSKYEQIYKPYIGPQKINQQSENLGGCLTGTVEKFNINETIFEKNYETNYQLEKKKNIKNIKKRKKINDPTNPNYKGPWEKSYNEDYVELTEEEQKKFENVEFIDEYEENEKIGNNEKNLQNNQEEEDIIETGENNLTKEGNILMEKKEDEDNFIKNEKLVKNESEINFETNLNNEENKEEDENVKKKLKSKKKSKVELEGEYTTFHLEKDGDYLGRSFIQHPKHLKADSISQNFLPKKWIHTWSGHKKGISRIEFFPKYGHLLLSSSFDESIKIWDVNDHKNCIRSYFGKIFILNKGHTESVIGVKFDEDGKKFASFSYDNKAKIWDTETGKVLQTFDCGEFTPYCVAFHPNGKNIMIGGSEKLVCEYDLNSKEEILKYDRHQGN